MHPPSQLEQASGGFAAKWMFALLVGTGVATVALLMRVGIPSTIAGNQAIFSYPAIVIGTLLYGARAGSIAGAVCFPFLWYYVVLPHQSFALQDWPAAVTLIMYLLLGIVLIWAIAHMRTAVRRYHAIATDLEAQVERRTAERNQLWERSRELLAIVTPDDVIHAVNPALSRLAKLCDPASTRRSFESLLFAEDRDRYQTALRNGDAVFEARLLTPGEPAWVSWSRAVGDAESYVIGRDFTAEHKCGEQLRQSQKMELVGQMAGGLAHDFGNLIPPISMTLHLLGKRHADDPRTRTLIEGAEESVERAGTLITRLLSLSRPSHLSPRAQAVGPLLEHIVPLLRQVVGHRRLDLHIAPGLPTVYVDPNQLDMALLNLVVNARDATAETGRLQLTANRTGDEWIEITLSDDGHGMDAEMLARATEPFFSTKASGQGSGLGLPMVHNFAVAAGGRLSLRSTVGFGTHVTIFLPCNTV